MQNLLHPHLSAATPPFMAAGPSPFGPNGLGSIPGMKPLGAGLPAYQPPALPGLAPAPIPGLGGTSIFNQGINGPLPLGRLHPAKHQAPAHHAPPPAKAAHACAPKPNAAPSPAPPAALHPAAPQHSVGGFFKRIVGADGHHGGAYNFLTGITGVGGPGGHMGAVGAGQVFFNGLGDALGDGGVALFTNDPDYKKALLDDAANKNEQSRTMLKGVLGGDHGLVATLGQAAADKLYAHEYPAAAAELNKDAAGQWSKAKAGVGNEAYNDPIGFALTVVPIAGVGRLAAVAKMGRAAEAAEAAASVANKAGDAEKAAALGRQATAFRQTARALEGGKAGAVLQRAKGMATEKLSAKAKAAAKTMQERRVGGPGGLKSSKSSIAIGRPLTARGLAGNQQFGPSAKGLHILNEKQLALHNRLVKSSPAGGTILKPGEVGFKDVAKLTEATGHEHAVVRLRDGSRMLIKGNKDSITHIAKMPVKRLIVHSHPGDILSTIEPSGKGGDLDYLWSIRQRQSYIVTSGATTPGVDYWVGKFDNWGDWKVLNPPTVIPIAGKIPYVKGPKSKY